jgi:hypothetical protein
LAARFINGAYNPKAAKLFTPLAASTYQGNKVSSRDLHLTPAGIISHLQRSICFISTTKILFVMCNSATYMELWTLYDALPTQCAQYSKLAAVTLVNQYNINFLCLYYQTSDVTADIKMVSYSPHEWKNDQPDLTDPPLFGTSLAAVKPEAGIQHRRRRQPRRSILPS